MITQDNIVSIHADVNGHTFVLLRINGKAYTTCSCGIASFGFGKEK